MKKLFWASAPISSKDDLEQLVERAKAISIDWVTIVILAYYVGLPGKVTRFLKWRSFSKGRVTFSSFVRKGEPTCPLTRLVPENVCKYLDDLPRRTEYVCETLQNIDGNQLRRQRTVVFDPQGPFSERALLRAYNSSNCNCTSQNYIMAYLEKLAVRLTPEQQKYLRDKATEWSNVPRKGKRGRRPTRAELLNKPFKM